MRNALDAESLFYVGYWQIDTMGPIDLAALFIVGFGLSRLTGKHVRRVNEIGRTDHLAHLDLPVKLALDILDLRPGALEKFVRLAVIFRVATGLVHFSRRQWL